MSISIRLRMLINIIVMAVPLALFAWLLIQEVQKQIDFASQEIQGLALQYPLTRLQHDVLAHKMALQIGRNAEPLYKNITEQRAVLKTLYEKMGHHVGFADQPLTDTDVQKISLTVGERTWRQAYIAVDQALEKISTSSDEASLTVHDDLATALKTMIARASDGSNLTLDPDLDSYYLMDALSFAIPNTIADLAGAQQTFLTILPERTKGLHAEQISSIAVWKHVLDSDDTGRILGSLGIGLAEDSNFNGVSETLTRIQPLMATYAAKHKELLEVIDAFYNAQTHVDQATINTRFDDVRESLMALYHVAREEMMTLLNIRIAGFEDHRKDLLIEGGSALLVGFVIFLLISQSIIGPINRLSGLMRRLAKGEIAIDIPYCKQKNEIGHMANALVVFKENAERMRQLGKDFESSVKQVVDIVVAASTEMSATSKDVVARAEDSHKRLAQLSTDFITVSGNIQTVSSAGEELTSSISEIGSQVQYSSTTMDTAVKEAGNVKFVAENLAQSAQKVSGIVGIINAIASKITLLSLNATIEAARAGEAGKGFAVVASEVKALATQTASATAEIGTFIADMQNNSQETLQAISQIMNIIQKMNEATAAIAAAVEEQGAATREISGHIREAADRLIAINKNTTTVTESASHSTASATQSLQASLELSKQSELLSSEVDKFLREIIAR